jgi:Mn2+/Fe2+ NRAMP family transporter
LVAAVAIVAVVFLCSYRQIEVIGITFGLFELAFVVSMFMMRPSPSEMATGLITFHIDREYLMLIASNLGAVIMPWMIYFQQSAIVARGLRINDEKEVAEERAQTFVGSCLTQLVMIGTLVTMAASPLNGNLENVQGFVEAMAPVFGRFWAKVVVSCAFLGGSMCAAFIVAITPAWAVCEAAGSKTSVDLDRPPTEAPLFYGCFLAVVAIGVCVLLSGVNVVKLNLYIMVGDALALPMALGFLYVLAARALPPDVRIQGTYKWLLGIVFTIVVFIGVATGIYGILGSAPTLA